MTNSVNSGSKRSWDDLDRHQDPYKRRRSNDPKDWRDVHLISPTRKVPQPVPRSVDRKSGDAGRRRDDYRKSTDPGREKDRDRGRRDDRDRERDRGHRDDRRRSSPSSQQAHSRQPAQREEKEEGE